MRILRSIAPSAAVLLVLILVVIGTVPAARADPSGPARPAVHGNRLIDTRTGTAWVPHGVNWPDLEYSCVQGWTPSHPAIETQRMAEWGIDVVRLPLNQDCWLGVDGAPVAGSGTATQYRAAVQARVDSIHAAGMVAILDLHWTGPAGTRANGQRSMADAQSVTFWSSVATAYRDDPSVMFELFNEPYSRGTTTALSWSCWAEGGCAVPIEPDTEATHGGTYIATGMDSLVHAVRATGATQPLLLGGLNYSNDLTGWLDHAPTDDQLVAAWHNYPGQGCWTSCWNDTILSVAAHVPVLMTEFGYVTGDPGAFIPTMEWADAHGIGYLPWAWWVTGAGDNDAASLYALVEGNNFTPKSPAGVQFHDHLAALAVAPTPDPVPDPDPSPPGPNPNPTASAPPISTGATAGALAVRLDGPPHVERATASTDLWSSSTGAA
jgi:endoglucanase